MKVIFLFRYSKIPVLHGTTQAFYLFGTRNGWPGPYLPALHILRIN